MMLMGRQMIRENHHHPKGHLADIHRTDYGFYSLVCRYFAQIDNNIKLLKDYIFKIERKYLFSMSGPPKIKSFPANLIIYIYLLR